MSTTYPVSEVIFSQINCSNYFWSANELTNCKLWC